jgi:cyclopropane-fatty-acyl-phospholipid synthase
LLKGYRLDLTALKTARGIRRNTKNTNLIEHCREQIGLTYDIGNDFYRFMLGPSMAYSCAIWPHAEASLDEAQRYKFDLIIEKLGISAEHRVLDIGCGWGSLCHRIHQRSGAQVKGIALSRNQIDGCQQRYPDLDFEYLDYRQEQGRYDRIVSVGMMEHVGLANIPLFLEHLADLLEPGGRALVHYLGPYDNIFINERHESHPDWGSVLMPSAQSPTHAEFIQSIMGCGRLRILHTETFSMHYARTGQCWNENLARHKEEILEKYPLKVYKSHEYAWYLGSAAMETGYGLVQFVLEKQPYGASYRDSVVDVVASRAQALCS